MVILLLGSSLSGLWYYFDCFVGLGIKVIVLFVVKKEKVFNVNVNFEIIFNVNGGFF